MWQNMFWPNLKPDPIIFQEGLSTSQPPLTIGKPGDEFQTLHIQNKKRTWHAYVSKPDVATEQ